MYDVVYRDRHWQARVLARAVQRDSAVTIARDEARRRRVGRMFLAGSEALAAGEMVVIVESKPTSRRPDAAAEEHRAPSGS